MLLPIQRFNPLHCGAVVASPPSQFILINTDLSFNPLHCGAVVASSRPRLLVLALAPGVSIPFIAGQWSLPNAPASPCGDSSRFQSPSLRGSGRFPPPMAASPSSPSRFQSPSLRGSGRFSGYYMLREELSLFVSIPFIAGQWSLLAVILFLSVIISQCFNPLHCGAVVASY